MTSDAPHLQIRSSNRIFAAVSAEPSFVALTMTNFDQDLSIPISRQCHINPINPNPLPRSSNSFLWIQQQPLLPSRRDFGHCTLGNLQESLQHHLSFHPTRSGVKLHPVFCSPRNGLLTHLHGPSSVILVTESSINFHTLCGIIP